MAYSEYIRFYFTDPSGLGYYTASMNEFGAYAISVTVAETSLPELPEKWQDITLMLDREAEYLGVFRKQGQGFNFSGAARAIILNVFFNNGGSEAELRLIIKKWKSTTILGATTYSYETEYDCFINFVDVSNAFLSSSTIGEQKATLSVSTIDSKIYKSLQAWGGNRFNVKLWDNTGGTTWHTDGKFVWYTGIKLLYSANFNSSADPTSRLHLHIEGFARGSTSSGRHTLPALFQYNIVQNNGATTFIGNDILQPYLIQKDQSYWQNETTFNGTNDSRPYTRVQFCLQNILPYGAGTDPIDMSVRVQMQLSLSGIPATCDVSAAGGGGVPFFLKAVLFEIDKDDLPVMAVFGTRYSYTEIGSIEIPAGAIVPGPTAGGVALAVGAVGDATHAASLLDATIDISMTYDKVYVIGLIIDTNFPPTGLGLNSASWFDFGLDNLKVNFFSKYNSGLLPTVIQAPIFPPSPVLGFDLATLWGKLVPMLNSDSTDPYGFPIIPAGTTYTGESTFLSTPVTYFDSDPTECIWMSGNALRIIEGQPYISVSINDFFKVCKSVWGCGLAIKNDKILIEKLETFFDPLTEIMDLSTNVAELKWVDFRDLKGATINAGYPTNDLNNDFGADDFNRLQNYNTPLKAYPEMIDLVAPIITADNAIEKMRQQQGGTTPSANNENVLLQCITTSSPTNFTAYDPSRNPVPVTTYIYPFDYPPAQAVDPSAATQPYIAGRYFPETAKNVQLSPQRNLIRNGALLRSLLDLQDGKLITFREQYQLLFDNSSIPIPGIASNLDVGSAATPFVNYFDEVSDIPVNSLPAQLFRPFILQVTTSTALAHAELNDIMNTNPNGYIKLQWGNRIYKGFIWSVTQKLADDAPTVFELLAHPDTTNDDLTAI